MAQDPNDDGNYPGKGELKFYFWSFSNTRLYTYTFRTFTFFAVEIRNNVLCTYVKSKKANEAGHFIPFSDFSASIEFHSLNRIKGKSTFYIFKCSSARTSEEFYVPVTIDDLVSNTNAIETFNKYREGYNAIIHKDVAKKSKFEQFCFNMIAEYDQRGPSMKKGCIAFEHLGPYDVSVNGGMKTIVIVGRGEIISASDDYDGSDLPVFYTGKNKALPNVYVAPFDLAKSNHFINLLIEYHSTNLGSLFSLFGFYHLSLQRSTLTKSLIKYGVGHILGNGQTGKSTIAEHFNMMMPRLAENLDKMADSTSLTVTRLLKKASEFGPVIIQDPPIDLKKIGRRIFGFDV